MSNSSDWYDEMAEKIRKFRDKFGEKSYKNYKLEYGLRVAKRVDSFSAKCDECSDFREEITEFVGNLAEPTSSTKGERKNRSRVIDNVTDHLLKRHRLVTKGQYVGKWPPIGLIMGILFGVTVGDGGVGVVVGMVAGVIIGAAIGTLLDTIAKKKGRII